MAKLDLAFYKGEDRYSDGDIEDSILEIVRAGKNAADAGTHSFPVLYHLSKVRENILSWYPFCEGASVLEIGAGPGAITGLLCRKCAFVTSVDLSKRRSVINYERHKDCGNLLIRVGNLNEMDFPEKFDYVIVNGVFEYAGGFTQGDRPYEIFLNKCRGFLKERGILLVAIENRLGLKYFSGAPEDHTDNYMEGLKNYPENTSVHTFSKSEWEDLMDAGGLLYRRFYYPFPDYKFPNEIYTDETLSADGFRRNAWNFNARRIELFPEMEMAQTLCREGVMDRFMNSFLIEMSSRPIEREEQILYAKMNTDRAPRFQIQTVIKTADGKKTVEKSPLTAEAAAHLCSMAERERQDGEGDRMHSGETGIPYLLRGEVLEDGSVCWPFLGKEDGFVSLGKEVSMAADSADADRVREIISFLWGLIQKQEYIAQDLNSADKDGGNAVSEELNGSAKDRDSFRRVFGNAVCRDAGKLVKPANIDLIFDNIFVHGKRISDGQAKQESSAKPEGVCVIDDEWVFDFPVPAKFILWRAVNELYSTHPLLERSLPQGKLLSEYGIFSEDRQVFWKWATHFEREYAGAGELADYALPVRKADLAGLRFSGTNVRLTATLYLDRGDGFNEKDAVHTDYVLRDGRADFSFEVEHPESVKAMRFDPVEGTACICSFKSQNVDLKPMNASAKRRGAWEFLTLDPAYKVTGTLDKKSEKGTAEIRVSGMMELKDMSWALAESQELLHRRIFRI